jgi:AraC-like DNA-binding protein
MSLRVHVARCIVEGFRLLGLPADSIAHRCQVPLGGEPSPFALLPESTFVALWTSALALDPSRNTLALEVGLALPIGGSGPLEYLSNASPTVGDGLGVLQGAAFALVAEDVRIEVDDSRRHSVAVAIVNTPFEGSWWSDELMIGLLLSRGRALLPATPGLGSPRVDLARPRPGNADRWEELLGLPVRFGTRHSALHVPRPLLELPLRTADENLAVTMRALLPIPTANRPSLLIALRAYLRPRLASRQSTSAAARAVGVSRRTLQRQLAEHGLTFRSVLDALKEEQAEHLLSDRSLSMFEVAQRLGFAEQASFTRAFRRWKRMTPLRWRERHSER